MRSALIAFITAAGLGGVCAQDIGADDLLGAAAGAVSEAGSTESSGGEGGQTPSAAGTPAEVPTVEEAAPGAAEGSAVEETAPAEAEGSAGAEGKPPGEEDGAKGRRGSTQDIENFVAFVYSPGPRDPFISPNAPSTIVQEGPEGEDITLESLMAFAEKLKGDLGERIRVVGVSIPPTGANAYALVIYASGKAAKGGAAAVEALPPRTVSVETGLPVRYPEEETLFISKLAQLVAQSSPIRLKRDSRVGAVIFPIQAIDDRGVLVSLPGYAEPILLPVYRDIDPRTESDN